MHSCIHYNYIVFLCIFARIQRRAEGDHTGQEYTGNCFILIYCVLFICIYIKFYKYIIIYIFI